MSWWGNTLPNRGQRDRKICRCARKIAFSCDFLLGGVSPSIRLQRGTQGYSACTLNGKTITEIPEYDSGLMDKERTEYSTTSRGNRRIFTRRINAEHLTGGGWQVVVRFAVDRRYAPVVGRLLRWSWRILGSRESRDGNPLSRGQVARYGESIGW